MIMFSFFAEAAVASYVLVVASASVPTVNIDKTCRAIVAAVKAQDDPSFREEFSACMKGQLDARQEMIEKWSDYPASDKQACVNTTGYLPNYVEWLGCFETSQMVRAIEKRERAR